MYNICTIAFLLFFFSGCTSNQSKEEQLSSFDDSIDLTGKVENSIDFTFKQSNVNINVQDTFLIIQTNVEPFFRIYSTNSHKLLVEFGSQGNGPQEFFAPELLKHFDYDSVNNSPVFQVFDLRKQLFARINILETIESQGNNSFEIESINTTKSNFFVYFFGSDGDFLLGQTEGFIRLLIYDKNNEREYSIGSTPELPYIISPDFWPLVYRSSAVINKEKGIIALAPTLLGQVDFFTTKGVYVNSLVIDEPTRFQEYFNSNQQQGEIPYIYFSKLEAHGNTIYGLNYNNRVTDYMEVRDNNMHILEFDWDANPIKKYVLNDGRLIVSFAYDPIHKRFYTFCPDERDHNIVVYEVEENM